jgi:hypothetical protein
MRRQRASRRAVKDPADLIDDSRKSEEKVRQPRRRSVRIGWNIRVADEEARESVLGWVQADDPAAEITRADGQPGRAWTIGAGCCGISSPSCLAS